MIGFCEGPLLGYILLTVVPSPGGEQRNKQTPYNSYKGTNPIHEGSTLKSSSNLNLSKAPPPNAITVGGWVGFYCEFWEDTNVQSITVPRTSS
jgi:hypothetical protein